MAAYAFHSHYLLINFMRAKELFASFSLPLEWAKENKVLMDSLETRQEATPVMESSAGQFKGLRSFSAPSYYLSSLSESQLRQKHLFINSMIIETIFNVEFKNT